MALRKVSAPFRVGDRVRVTRKTRDGIVLPDATVIAVNEKSATIRYDDDPPYDSGFPENLSDLDLISRPLPPRLFARLFSRLSS